MVQATTDNGKQSWFETCLETTIGIIIGFTLACLGNAFWMWLYGYTFSFQFITGLGAFMTLLSMIRQICLRRLFEHIRVNRWVPRALTKLRGRL